jgi:TatD DNase family protein
MIDSHCHLTDPSLASQLDAVLSRAATAGVAGIISIGTDRDDWSEVVRLLERFPHLRGALGIHPNYCHEAEPEDLDRLEDLLRHPSIVGLGETGLDYHHHFAPVELQKQFFRAQLELAARCSLPVVIHCREAVDDALAILADYPGIRCVFHCFTGSELEAHQIAAAGHFLGFTGALTYKKADSLRQTVSRLARDRVLVETDAPYLSPEPHRSRRPNEPAWVMHVAEVLARTWGVERSEVDRLTTANVRSLFGWPA